MVRFIKMHYPKIYPPFDGHTSFAAYRQDFELWLLLTTLNEKKKGPALIGRLSGGTKASAKSSATQAIGGEDGAIQILDHLEKVMVSIMLISSTLTLHLSLISNGAAT